MDAFETKLRSRLVELSLTLDDSAVGKLLAYHALLVKWNRAYNLTSIRDADEMIDRHLIDSLSILPAIDEADLLDVGTGPGLPGMVLALVKPQLSVWLLDSNGKKTRFLNQVKMSLKLSNVEVVHHRLESWQPGRQFHQITSRAFATLADMVVFSRHLLAKEGRFIAMKGVYPETELAELPQGMQVLNVASLQVPGNDGERHLIEIGHLTQ